MAFKKRRRSSKYPSKRYSVTPYAVGTQSERMEKIFSAHLTNLVMRGKQLPPFPQVFLFTSTRGVFADGSGVITDNVKMASSIYSTTDFAAAATLYDMFRVIGFQIEFYPSTQASPETALVYSPLPVIFDPDSVPSMTVDICLQYETKAVWDIRNRQKFTFKVPKYSTVANGSATGSSYQCDSDGFVDAAAQSTAFFGAVCWYGDGYTASGNYGTVIYKHLVAFKYRR